MLTITTALLLACSANSGTADPLIEDDMAPAEYDHQAVLARAKTEAERAIRQRGAGRMMFQELRNAGVPERVVFRARWVPEAGMSDGWRVGLAGPGSFVLGEQPALAEALSRWGLPAAEVPATTFARVAAYLQSGTESVTAVAEQADIDGANAVHRPHLHLPRARRVEGKVIYEFWCRSGARPPYWLTTLTVDADGGTTREIASIAQFAE